MPDNSYYSEFMTIVKSISDIDAEYAIESIGGSEELYKKMLAQMIRLTPQNVKQMDECIGANDLNLFGVKVHGVKGALRQAGCLRLAKYAEALENEAKAGNAWYCREHYCTFRDKLLCFAEQMRVGFESTEEETDVLSANEFLSDINGYTDILAQVKAAVEDYDSLLATERLLPLTKKWFGESANSLIKKTMEELNLFRPQTALVYITELIDKCGQSDSQL